MIRFHRHSNVLNHVKNIFLCSCGSLLGSPDIAQETGAKLHFSIEFSIDHFTVVCSVTRPLDGSEAGVDLVLIQTSLLLLCKASCSNAN